jgi:hypothetical protein
LTGDEWQEALDFMLDYYGPGFLADIDARDVERVLTAHRKTMAFAAWRLRRALVALWEVSPHVRFLRWLLRRLA